MSTTTLHSEYDEGQFDLSYLPKNAVTEWMRADGPSAVEIEEDVCGNIIGKGKGVEKFDDPEPCKRVKRTVASSHQFCLTNLHWAKEEVRQHNLKHPDRPWVIRYNKHNSDFICIIKASKE